MIPYPDKTSISPTRRLFTALVLAFFIHNAEETYTICWYPTENPFIKIQTLNCEQFLVAVTVISLATFVLYLAAVQISVNQRKYLFISTGLSAALLLNSIIPHLLVAILTWHYTPGIISTVLLILPLSILLLSRNREQYNNRREMIVHAILFIIPAYLFFGLVARLTMLFI